MPLDITIRHETPSDHAAIRMVHHDAFGPQEPIDKLVDGLRNLSANLPTLSLVATVDDAVTGHVMLSHGWLDAPKQLIDVYSSKATRNTTARAGLKRHQTADSAHHPCASPIRHSKFINVTATRPI